MTPRIIEGPPGPYMVVLVNRVVGRRTTRVLNEIAEARYTRGLALRSKTWAYDASHGGGVANAYKYPAMTDVAVSVSDPLGNVVTWLSTKSANKVTLSGAVRTALDDTMRYGHAGTAGILWDKRYSNADCAKAALQAAFLEVMGQMPGWPPRNYERVLARAEARAENLERRRVRHEQQTSWKPKSVSVSYGLSDPATPWDGAAEVWVSLFSKPPVDVPVHWTIGATGIKVVAPIRFPAEMPKEHRRQARAMIADGIREIERYAIERLRLAPFAPAPSTKPRRGGHRKIDLRQLPSTPGPYEYPQTAVRFANLDLEQMPAGGPAADWLSPERFAGIDLSQVPTGPPPEWPELAERFERLDLE